MFQERKKCGQCELFTDRFRSEDQVMGFRRCTLGESGNLRMGRTWHRCVTPQEFIKQRRPVKISPF